MFTRSTSSAHRRQRWLAPLTIGLLALAAAAAAPVGAAAVEYRDCSGITLEPGAAAHRCDLTGATIIGLDLHGIGFAWSNLTGVNGGCDPDQPRTNLADARIYRAILVNAKLCDAILSGADLHGSDLTNAALEDASLIRTNLSWAVLDGAGAGFAPFFDANLSNASWVGGSAIGASFDGADLHRIDLRGTNLRAASLTAADLRYAQLDGVDFSGADLTGAIWSRATGRATAIYADTTCPDGSNSDANSGTCVGH